MLKYLDENIIKIDGPEIINYVKNAIESGHLSIIKYLLPRMNDVDKFKIYKYAFDRNYFITKFFKIKKFTDHQFCKAISNGNYLMIKYMIDSGYNTKRNIKNNMQYAITNCQSLIIKYLFNQIENANEFFKFAVDKHNLEVIKLIIKLANINDFNYILQAGAQQNQIQLVKFALKKGVDIDLRKNHCFGKI